MALLIPSSDDVRIYECTILYPYPLSQKEEQTVLKEVETVFAEAGAKMIEKDPWGRRGLAYPIGGFTEGCYVVYYYEMEPSKLKEIDTALRITPHVLRHMMIKPPKGYEMVKFSAVYEDWSKNKKSAKETALNKKEDDLKRKVVERAKRQVKRVEEQKKEDAASKPSKPMKKENITEKLEELISGDDLEI